MDIMGPLHYTNTMFKLKSTTNIIELLKKSRLDEYFSTIFQLANIYKQKIGIIDKLILEKTNRCCQKHNYKELA